MVDPSSRYTPVVISTFTSHLWKRKKGLVLVVCITTYQPWLVIAWKIAACVDMWNVHSTVTWGYLEREQTQRTCPVFMGDSPNYCFSKEYNLPRCSLSLDFDIQKRNFFSYQFHHAPYCLSLTYQTLSKKPIPSSNPSLATCLCLSSHENTQ